MECFIECLCDAMPRHRCFTQSARRILTTTLWHHFVATLTDQAQRPCNLPRSCDSIKDGVGTGASGPLLPEGRFKKVSFSRTPPGQMWCWHGMSISLPAPDLSGGWEEGREYKWPSREHGKGPPGHRGSSSVILRAQGCELEPKGPVLWTWLEKSSGEDF